VGLLGSDFPLSFSTTQGLLDQLPGVEISCRTITTIRRGLSAALYQPMNQAISFARQQPVVYVGPPEKVSPESASTKMDRG
jgi:hypothetical protein